MTTVVVTGAKHSPGVTTLALALTAAAAETMTACLIELDAAGGDIAVDIGFSPDPGLVSLAAACRHGSVPELAAHAAPLPAGGSVIAAPPDAQLASTAAAAVTPAISALSHQVDLLVVDCGRAGAQSDILPAADVVLLCARPSAAGVAHARERLRSLETDAVLVLLGTTPYSVAEVAGVTGAGAVVAVPVDHRGVAGLHGTVRRGASRSPLLRAVRSLAESLPLRSEVSA